MDSILQWLQEQFDNILDALNIIRAIQDAAGGIASMLPIPDPDTIAALRGLPDFLSFFLEYISWLDFFIDLRFFIFTLLIMFAVEAFLLLFRGWRMLRSILT